MVKSQPFTVSGSAGILVKYRGTKERGRKNRVSIFKTKFIQQIFLAAFTFRRRAVDRWEGVLFLVIYAAYIAYLVR